VENTNFCQVPQLTGCAPADPAEWRKLITGKGILDYSSHFLIFRCSMLYKFFQIWGLSERCVERVS